MLCYCFDGSEDGFYTAVFTAYEKKEKPDRFVPPSYQPALNEECREVVCDEKKAARVREKLRAIRAENVAEIRMCLRTKDDEAPTAAYRYIAACLQYGASAIERQADRNVFTFCALFRRVQNEIHRFKGFLRFEEAAGGYYYAHFSPDNDICDLLLPHFTARYHGMPFVIHDVKRNILAFYDGKNTRVLRGNGTITVQLSQEEEGLQNLWRAYYDAVTIAERTNEKNMRGFLPTRYWEHLSEKNRPLFSQNEEEGKR